MSSKAPPAWRGRDLLRHLARVLSWVWRWSLVVTLPLTCVLVLWALRTADKYRAMGLRFETLGEEVNLQRLAEFERHVLERELVLAMSPFARRVSRLLPSVELYVPEASEAALDRALPHSGKEYVPASLVYPTGEIGEVEMRYRGDHFWHWAARKKSLRIKTKKSHLYQQMRSFNVVAPKMPEQISGYISYFLGRQLDLITPRCKLVDLHVNGRYRGIHLLLEQLDEGVLRANRRMPGDAYAVDMAGRDRYRGVPNAAFQNAGFWEKISVNNHFDEDESEALERLIQCVQDPSSPERTQTLASLVDLEAFGRFGAFRLLCISEHFDNAHNWRLYYDPWKNRFEPIVWDPVGWAVTWRPTQARKARLDIVSSHLDQALMEDHAFLAARERALLDYFGDGRDAELVEEIDRVVAALVPSVVTDPGLAYKIKALPVPWVLDAMRRFRITVNTVLDQLREAYLEAPALRYVAEATHPGTVRIGVSGRRGIRGIAIQFEQELSGPLEARATYLGAEGAQTVDVTGALVRRGSLIELELDLRGRLEPSPEPSPESNLSPIFLAAEGVYQLTLTGGAVASSSIVAVNGLGRLETTIMGLPVQQIDPDPFRFAQRVLDPVPVATTQIWEGRRIVQGVEVISDSVIIRPGSELLMGPGASLIFEGQLLAQGTAAAPIRIVPVEKEQAPWGVVALRGAGASGSQLNYCQMLSGSGLKTPMAEFSAMLSLHDVRGVRVEHCEFANNRIVDDMVHAVYSSVEFRSCNFVRSLFDALDLDITEAVVDSCKFIGSGNDALDLMTSEVLVKDCWIEASGDKGVSVGEGTRAMILNCGFKSCEIGVQIKDSSTAVVCHGEFVENEVAIDAYKKNWRYDAGGTGDVYNSLLVDNRITLQADRHSSLSLHDCGSTRGWFKSGDGRTPKQVVLDETCAIGPSRSAKGRALSRLPGEVPVAGHLFHGAWQSVRPLVRGLIPGRERN